MAFKSITAIATNLAIDGSALAAAADLTEAESGHLDVLCLGIDYTQPGFYYAGASEIALQTSLAEAESDARKVEEEVRKLLENRALNWSTHACAAQIVGLTQNIAHRARFSDLAVLARPYGEGRKHEHEVIVESALFDAKIPVIVIPDGKALPRPVKRIVVAWNESQEALIAVRAALPILKQADVVNIAIVDPPAHAPDRSDPGGALSQMLVRHGVRAEVSVLAKTMPRVSDVIARHVRDQDAELLVMGAYGHSRIRESILGGATRNTLQTTKIPVLMAH